jgi:hypothetical protein
MTGNQQPAISGLGPAKLPSRSRNDVTACLLVLIQQRLTLRKLATIATAAVFAMASTFALAQGGGGAGSPDNSMSSVTAGTSAMTPKTTTGAAVRSIYGSWRQDGGKATGRPSIILIFEQEPAPTNGALYRISPFP